MDEMTKVEQVDISKNTKFMCCDMFISVKINLKRWKEWTTYIEKAAKRIRAIPILVKEENLRMLRTAYGNPSHI
jgi:hypothetical protein